MEKIFIGIDCMGGDNAPYANVKGSILALSNENISLKLYGDEKKINEILLKETYDKNRIEIIHTSQIIENEDTPTKAIKEKKDSSMIVGLKDISEEKSHGFVSSGSTGALLAGSTMIVGRIKGVKRPFLGTSLPNATGHTFLVDAGANSDCKPEYLYQFALISSLYLDKVMGIKNPRVGLVNIGTEEGKGNELTKETFYLLKNSKLNFVGNIEGRDIPEGKVDIAVCDGFAGNIILKVSEGTTKAFTSLLKEEFVKSPLTKIGALLSKPVFAGLRKKFDYREIGGAPFLGLNALVVKAHGSSDEVAIKNAIFQCYSFSKSGAIKSIEEGINLNETLKTS